MGFSLALRRSNERQAELLQDRSELSPLAGGAETGARAGWRGEGREFGNGATDGRCLIVADGFYEYAEPEGGGGKGRKRDRWLFTRRGEDFFCIAGIWRSDAKVGEACTMLTAEPGPGVAPYHGRQIVVIERTDWGRWLDASAPAAALLQPSPAGTFEVRPA